MHVQIFPPSVLASREEEWDLPFEGMFDIMYPVLERHSLFLPIQTFILYTPLFLFYRRLPLFAWGAAATNIVFISLNMQGLIFLSLIPHAVKCHANSRDRYVMTNPITTYRKFSIIIYMMVNVVN